MSYMPTMMRRSDWLSPSDPIGAIGRVDAEDEQRDTLDGAEAPTRRISRP